MQRAPEQFDPRGILVALERSGVDYVLIGGLAQVIRGADIRTSGVDICPSFGPRNLDRLSHAVEELGAQPADHGQLDVSETALAAAEVVSLSTAAGALRIVGAPAGAPKGFVDLRRAASKEHLGHGVQPLVASIGDLARMASALHREVDVERLPQLRRIIELEAIREPVVGTATQVRQSGRAVSPDARRVER